MYMAWLPKSPKFHLIVSEDSSMRITESQMHARASVFVERHKNDRYEKGEMHTFYDDFFRIFGLDRKGVSAIFEMYVKSKISEEHGYIDLFWPKKLLVEQKSRGHSLDKAWKQAMEYFDALGISNELPRFVLLSDFQTFRLYDLTNAENKRGDEKIEPSVFKLTELPKYIHLFYPIMLDEEAIWKIGDPVSQEASKKMDIVYKALKKSGYPKHDMEKLLARLAFCMFADYTGIFDRPMMFRQYITSIGRNNCENLGPKLMELFDVLNTDVDERPSRPEGDVLSDFPYIDGGLFKGDRLAFPVIDKKMFDAIAAAASYDWSYVQPVIFGSLFQGVLNPEERREEGAHYTMERNIIKVLKPLFMDELNAEINTILAKKTGTEARLKKFQKKLAELHFLDPACGAGNFLAIAYREIRLLEHKAILKYRKDKAIDVSKLVMTDVHQFHGIETNEFSARLAETALWMTDHLMNRELATKLGEPFLRIPLKKSPNIQHADALEKDWNKMFPKAKFSYILGNPPFGGQRVIGETKRNQVKTIGNDEGVRKPWNLDYVSAWFILASKYAPDGARIGLVATNSITQGVQVGELWPVITKKYGMRITFAYRPFLWDSEAKKKAHVVAVIIGLSKDPNGKCVLYDYDEEGKPIIETTREISPYLMPADVAATVIRGRRSPLSERPKMTQGSQVLDKGHYTFKDEEKEKFLEKEPIASEYMRQYSGGQDFIYKRARWVLYMRNINPEKLNRMPHVKKRVELVEKFRMSAKRKQTNACAEFPTTFCHEVIPKNKYVLIPRVSSENRRYIPMGYVKPKVIPSDAALVIEDPPPGLLGLLMSAMHMAWIDMVAGRLKTDYRYSMEAVYNTFPFPPKGFASLEKYENNVLEARDMYPDATPASLYDRSSMPKELKDAHKALDRAVDSLYKKGGFRTDIKRIVHLLSMYKKQDDADRKRRGKVRVNRGRRRSHPKKRRRGAKAPGQKSL